MKQFCEPELNVAAFEVEDVIAVSGDPNIGSETDVEWG